LIGRIERATGIPGLTTATTVLAALRALDVRRVAVATPYIDELNAIEADFLAAAGFPVAAIDGLGCATDPEIGRFGPADATALAARVDRPDADAIFISCTNLHCLEAIAPLEARHGKPVVTSNQAGAWAALRAIGVADDVGGLGRLFGLPAPLAAGAPA
jgi:maleate cis-trans isomerase